jgi:hypothetical protein
LRINVGTHDFVTKMCMIGTSRETNIAISNNRDFYCHDGILSEAENLNRGFSAEPSNCRDWLDVRVGMRRASRTTSPIATVKVC